jgi:hypothetical protein
MLFIVCFLSLFFRSAFSLFEFAPNDFLLPRRGGDLYAICPAMFDPLPQCFEGKV